MRVKEVLRRVLRIETEVEVSVVVAVAVDAAPLVSRSRQVVWELPFSAAQRVDYSQSSIKVKPEAES